MAIRGQLTWQMRAALRTESLYTCFHKQYSVVPTLLIIGCKGEWFLRNIGNHLPSYVASHLTKPKSSITLL